MNVRMVPLLGLGLLGSLLLAGCTSTPKVEVNTGPDQSGVSVSGRGEVVVNPDVGQVTLGVEVRAPTVAAAREEAAQAAQAMLDAVKGDGVEARDIRTTGLSIYPDYRYPRDGDRVLIGFVVTNTVTITVTDLDVFSNVVDDAIEAGGDAARLQGISFDVDDREEAIAQARGAAMDDARARAEQLVRAAGGELGAVLSISEVSLMPPSPIYFDAGVERKSGAGTPIEPGSTTVTVDVQVRWAIE